VELIIPLRLVLPDEPIAFADVEARVCAAGRTALQAAYAAAWVAQATLTMSDPCPHCGAHETRPAGHKPRRIETPVGAVTVARPRRQCAGVSEHLPASGQ
jgi:hypothetical protein